MALPAPSKPLKKGIFVGNCSVRKAPSNKNVTTRWGNTTVGGPSHGVTGEDVRESEDLLNKMSYNNYIESLFLQSILEEKVNIETTQIDLRLAELAKRLEINKLILRKTQDRLKDISFHSEHQKIVNERKICSNELLKQSNNMQADQLLENFNINQNMYCDRLLIKNINMGNEESSSYKELQSTIQDTIKSLERAKTEWDLDCDEVGTMCSVSHQLKECKVAKDQIESNLKQYETMTAEVSSEVLETASIELASTLSGDN